MTPDDTLDVPMTSDPAAVPNIADQPDPAAEVFPPAADVLPEKPKRAPRAPRTPRTPRAPRAAGTRKPRLNIAKSMAELYTMAGIGVSMIPAPLAQGTTDGSTVASVIGTALAANATACGEAWQKAADEDENVRAAIERLLTVSVWGALIGAHLPIILAGAAAAGVVPPALVGTAGGASAK